MLKDIQRVEVEDIAIAVVPGDENNEKDTLWKVYLINLKESGISNVIVSSKGYGTHKGEQVKTSVLRHYLGEIAALDYILIEPIQQEVFGLNNEYWVSFYIGEEIYDRKFVFLPETITSTYFTLIPFLNKQGVMIR